MTAPLSAEPDPTRCVCQTTPVADPTLAEHAVWCPSRKPTAERIAEIKAGTGRPLMAGELEWLRGDAGRAELHISGAAAGAFPLSDNLPDWIAELGRKLGAVVAELDRTRTVLDQSENDLTGTRLSLWEEEQDTRRMRVALESARRGRRELRARVADLTDAAALDAEQRRLEVEATGTRMGELYERIRELKAERGRLLGENADLEARLHAVGAARTWRMENGKKFIYVEDIASAVLNTEAGDPR